MELLRVFSMLGIVILHCFLYANGGDNAVNHDIRGYMSLLENSIFIVSVNVFVLISGYFTIGSRGGHYIKIRKLLNLYLMMVFYILLFVLMGFFSHKIEIHPSHYLPLKSDVYWFMTIYFQLMLIAPFLVRLVDCLDRYWYRCLLLLLFVLTTVIQIRGTDGGYSLFWFVFLFLFAGYLKLYDVRIKRGWILIIYFVSLLFYWLLRISGLPLLNWLFSFCYSNIFVFLMSVCILLWFCGIGNLNKGGRILAKLAPYTLGVYLIHEHPIVREYLWAQVRNLFPIMDPLYIILVSIVVFCVCVLIEWLRQMLFKLLRVDVLVNKVCDKLKGIVERHILQER